MKSHTAFLSQCSQEELECEGLKHVQRPWRGGISECILTFRKVYTLMVGSI